VAKVGVAKVGVAKVGVAVKDGWMDMMAPSTSVRDVVTGPKAAGRRNRPRFPDVREGRNCCSAPPRDHQRC
jgi:hypothetical protein